MHGTDRTLPVSGTIVYLRVIRLAKPHRWHDRSDRFGSAKGAPVGQDERARYRTTRAPPPLICFSTSARVAMEVSPGVVLARAPWAAP